MCQTASLLLLSSLCHTGWTWKNTHLQWVKHLVPPRPPFRASGAKFPSGRGTIKSPASHSVANVSLMTNHETISYPISRSQRNCRRPWQAECRHGWRQAHSTEQVGHNEGAYKTWITFVNWLWDYCGCDTCSLVHACIQRKFTSHAVISTQPCLIYGMHQEVFLVCTSDVPITVFQFRFDFD